MFVIFLLGSLMTTVFALKGSEISYCTYYGGLCNPDFRQPCCNQSFKCSLVQPEGEYRCIKQVELGGTCHYNSDCSAILWHAFCSSDHKCVCRSDAIQVGQRCESLVDGYCTYSEQCAADNSVCSNYKCKCKHHFLPVAHNLCIQSALGVPCLNDQSCSGIKNSKCSDNFCRCKSNTMMVSSTMCGKFLDDSCQRDDDCGPKYSICVKFRCTCPSRFFRENNTQCNPPQLTMPCKTYTDCNNLIKYSLCSDENKCECFPSHFPINETTCVPYYESYCSDSDPCRLENSVCIDNVCRCAPNFNYVGHKCIPTFLDKPCEIHEGRNCISLLNGFCHSQEDCYDLNSICIHNKCQCKVDYMANLNNQCVPKLTMTCKDDDECKMLYFQKCSIGNRNSFNHSSTKCRLEIGDECSLNEQCTPEYSLCINKRCQCKTNFVASKANDGCVSIFSTKQCWKNEECNEIKNSMCSVDGICVCEPNFERIDENTCAPLLEQFCDEQTKCATDDAVCSGGQCTCDASFVAQSNNRCLPTFLKQTCKQSDDCKHIKYAECSIDNKCDCQSNYVELNKVTCAPFIGGYCENDRECFVNLTKCIDNKCAFSQNSKLHPNEKQSKCLFDKDCFLIENSKCSTNGKCVCKSNHVLYNQTTCLPLLNEQCFELPCGVDNSECIKNKCQCMNHYIQQSNNKCLPTFLNEACKTDTDCKEIKNSVCSTDKICICKKHYSQFNLTTCTSLTEEYCTKNQNCPVENSACINNFCRCKPNFEKVSNHLCVPQIAIRSCTADLHCNDISNSFCLNKKCACKPNYVAVNNTMCLIRSSGYCYNETDCLKTNGFCFHGQCLCKSNYNFIDGHCIPISLGAACRKSSDCSKILNARCSDDNKCICKSQYYAIDRFSCAPMLGVECSNDNPCRFEDSECYLESTCQCRSNYYAVSEIQCLPKKSTFSCNQNLDCGEHWHAVCSTDKKCSCKENNFSINKSTCLPLLGGPCWQHDQCLTGNAVCSDFHCRCRDGYTAVSNNLCVRDL